MTNIESQVYVDAAAALRLMEFEALALDVEKAIELYSSDQRGTDELFDALLDACDELRCGGMNLLAAAMDMLAGRIKPLGAVESRGSECLECGEPARYH